MKKNKKIMLFMIALSILVVGCGDLGGKKDAKNVDDDTLSVALIVNGTIGDKSFNDLANSGLKKAADEFGIKTKLVENNYDTTKYEPVLIEFSEDPEWDLIILNGYDIKEIVEKIAPQYPDKKYALYDADIDFSKPGLENVYSVLYRQSEASFLAGALAAKMTSVGDDERINTEKLIGFIAGGENTIINDFLVGYIEGAQYADDDVKMYISYIGDFKNAAKGKEMTMAQYLQNSDIVFQVAAGAGVGVIAAATESGKYVIGVDSDQYELFKDSNIDQANSIMTSVLKKVDGSIYNIIKRAYDGTLPYGINEIQGLEDSAVGIAKNDYYKTIVPQDIQDYIDDVENKIIDGEIKVGTSLDKTTDEINAIRNSIRAN